MASLSIQTYSLANNRFCWSGIGVRNSAAADPDMQPHRHSFFQIFFVASGSAVHELGDLVLDGQAGSIFFISPYTTHRVTFPADAECYVIYFNAQCLQDGTGPLEAAALDVQLLRRPELAPFVHQPHCNYQLEPQLRDEVRQRCLRIQACCAERGPYDAAQARAELVLLLTSVAKQYADHFISQGHYSGCAGPVIDARARGALDFIQRNFKRPLSLGEVAEHVHLTGTYLTQLLKRELGQSFKQILDETRLETSKNLLAYTDARMQKIALDSGFIDQAHFAKRFRAYTRLTPGQFRRQHRSSLTRSADCHLEIDKSSTAPDKSGARRIPTMS